MMLVKGLSMFPAARLMDMHVCAACAGAPMPIVAPGQPNVLIGGMPAARQTDMCACVASPISPVPVPDPIAMGSPVVLIGGLPAAYVSAPTMKGGVIIPPGCPTVIIGLTPRPVTP